MEHQKRALAGHSLTEEQIAAHKQKIATIAPQIKQMTTKLELSFSQRLLKFFGLVSCFAFSLSMYGHLLLCLRAVEEDATGRRSRQNDLLDLNLVQSRQWASYRAQNILNSVLLSAHLLLRHVSYVLSSVKLFWRNNSHESHARRTVGCTIRRRALRMRQKEGTRTVNLNDKRVEYVTAKRPKALPFFCRRSHEEWSTGNR